MSSISETLKKQLVQNKPYLQIYFQTPIPDNKLRFELDTTKADAELVTFHNGKQKSALSSRYDPHKEAQNMLAKYAPPWQASTIVILLGLGNPNLLPQVLARLQKNQLCLAVDASFALGQLLCQNSPLLWQFLQRSGCHLFCGDALRPSLQHYLSVLPVTNLTGVQVITHPPSVRLAQEEYRQLEVLIRDTIKARMSDLLTRFEFESLWVKNILINSHYMPPQNAQPSAAPPPCFIRAYHNCLKQVPGVLVAAGPSLQESLADLRILQDRAFILCVDSALKVLLSAGIKPHAVITLDAQPHTLFAFQGLDLKRNEILLFADIASNPVVLRKIKLGQVIFTTTAQVSHDVSGNLQQEFTLGSEFIHKIHGDIGYLQSGGSVATSGFDLLRMLGCDPIAFFGLDQAYTERRIHSNGTYHMERWLPLLSRSKTIASIIERIVRKRHTFNVPAIDGGEILSDHVLSLYKSWFADALPQCEMRVLQLTKRGALLNGAENIASAAWCDSLPKQSAIQKAFAQAPALRYFSQIKFNDLANELRETLINIANAPKIDAANDKPELNAASMAALNALFAKYPFLKFARRQADLYIQRNVRKLTSEQAQHIRYAKSLSALQDLEHSLRAYLADGCANNF